MVIKTAARAAGGYRRPRLALMAVLLGAALGCGKTEPSPFAAGTAGAAGTGSTAGTGGGSGGADVASMDAAPTDAAPDSAPARPFATAIRVVNGGVGDFQIYFERSFACPLGFMIRGDGTTTLPQTALEAPDTTCDCSTCGLGLGGGPRCQSVDLLCEDPPIRLPPGQTFTFSWDGTVLTWFEAGPAAGCPVRCSRITEIPTGSYVFALVQPTGTYRSAPTPLPAPDGVVTIPVNVP